MDSRELSQRLAALQKMINEKEPAAGIITVLETLKKEVVPTEELLRVGSSLFGAFLCSACKYLLYQLQHKNFQQELKDI
jgi:hypothetical protein